MSFTEWVQASGTWSIRLRPDTPQEIIDAIAEWDHLLVFDQRVDADAYSDADLKSLARYSGVITELPDSNNSPRLQGSGLGIHLGDPDGVGDVFETEVSLDADTLADSTRALLPAGGSIIEGTFETVTGSLTADFQWVTPRQAVDYVASIFTSVNAEDVEWRVNPDGTLDIGKVSQLYSTDPSAETRPPVIIHGGGDDLGAKAVPVSSISGGVDGQQRITRQVILAQGTGDEISTGEADQAGHGLKDFHGNDLVRTRLSNEASTEAVNADDRATFLLGKDSAAREQWDVDLAHFVVQGEFALGDTVYAYDRRRGLYDETQEVTFDGEPIAAKAIRVVGWGWTPGPDAGFVHRAADGTNTDISDYVVPTQASMTLHLGDKPDNNLDDLNIQAEIAATRYTEDTTSPEPPTSLLATGDNWINGRGRERGALVLTWVNPTLNTDGSTIVNPPRLGVGIRVNGSGDDYEYFNVNTDDWPGGEATLTHRINRLAPNTEYDLNIKSFYASGRSSTWQQITGTTAVDGVAPSQPSAPGVIGTSTSTLEITHDLLKNAGGNLEADLTKFRVYVSPTSPVTIAASNIARVYRIGNDDIGEEVTFRVRAYGPKGSRTLLTRGTNYYVALVAVDEAGNGSTTSPEAGPIAAGSTDIPAFDSTGNVAPSHIVSSMTSLAAISNADGTLNSDTVDTAQIVTDAVTDNEVSDVTVDKLTDGTQTAAVTMGTGALFKTDVDTENRVEIRADDPDKMRLYPVEATVVGASVHAYDESTDYGYINVSDVSGWVQIGSADVGAFGGTKYRSILQLSNGLTTAVPNTNLINEAPTGQIRIINDGGNAAIRVVNSAFATVDDRDMVILGQGASVNVRVEGNLEVTGDAVYTGGTTFDVDVTIGAGFDLTLAGGEINFNAATGYIDVDPGASAGDLYLRAADAGGTLRNRLFIDGDGPTYFYDAAGGAMGYANSSLWSFANNVSITGTLTTTGTITVDDGTSSWVSITDMGVTIDRDDSGNAWYYANSNAGHKGMLFGEGATLKYYLSVTSSDDFKVYSYVRSKDIIDYDTSADLLQLEVPTSVTGTLDATDDITSGQARMGTASFGTGYADFSESSRHSSSDYSFLSLNLGDTFVNAKTGYSVFMRVNNANVGEWTSAGLDITGTLTADDSITVSSAGDATITIEADTDNVTETDNPTLLLKQDAGGVQMSVGIDSNNQGYVDASYLAASNLIFTAGSAGIISMTGQTTIGSTDAGQNGSLLLIGDLTTVNADAGLQFGKAETATASYLPGIRHGSVISAGSTNDLLIAAQSTGGGIVFYTGASTSPGTQYIGTNSNAERLRLVDAGATITGTLTTTGLTTLGAHLIVQSTSAPYITLQATGGATQPTLRRNSSGGLEIDTNNSIGASSTLFLLENQAADRLLITGDGSMTLTGTLTTTARTSIGPGDVTPHSYADLAVEDTNGTQAMVNILTNVTGGETHGYLGFGDDADPFIGWVSYSHNDDTLRFGAANAERMTLNSGGLDVTATVDATAFTDGYITWTAAQMNRTAGRIELQYSGAAGTEGVRMFGNTAYPAEFHGGTGILTVTGGITSTGNLDVLTANIVMDETTASTIGVIEKSGYRFLHNFQHPDGDSATPTGRNVFLGEEAGNFTMGSTASSTAHGSYNIGIGYTALSALTTGYANIAIGHNALDAATTPYYNVGIGHNTLSAITTGYGNTAVGGLVGESWIAGSVYNTAVGYHASRYANSHYNAVLGANAFRGASGNTSNSESNVAVGYGAMYGAAMAVANYNVALGRNTLYNITSGDGNVAVGMDAGNDITTATGTVLIGAYAGDALTTPTGTIAIGYAALSAETTITRNTIIGYRAFTSSSGAQYNTALGYQAGYYMTGGDYNTYIGQEAGYYSANQNHNTAVGNNAMYGVTGTSEGTQNTAVGSQAMQYHGHASDGGDYNVAMGVNALRDVTSGDGNIGIGVNGAGNITTGDYNIGIGYSGLGGGAVSGDYNIGIGYKAAFSMVSSTYNVAIGFQAMLYDSSGDFNTAVGTEALMDNTTGTYNTALGHYAGRDANATGDHGVFVGYNAGRYAHADQTVAIGSNAFVGKSDETSTGVENTAVGYAALYGVGATTAHSNTAIGYAAIYSVTTGYGNTGVGTRSLYAVNTGYRNVGIGHNALNDVTTGYNNVGVGTETGGAITTGYSNTFIGHHSGQAVSTGTIYNANVGMGAGQYGTDAHYTAYLGAFAGQGGPGTPPTGDGNVAVGYSALKVVTTGGHNTMVGYGAGIADTTGYRNIFLGALSGQTTTTGDLNIVIGYDIDAPAAGSNNSLNIGGTLFGTSLYSGALGKIGINEQTPQYNLEVQGSMYADELHVRSFIADMEQALIGGQIIARSTALVAVAFNPQTASDITVYDNPLMGDGVSVFGTSATVMFREIGRATAGNTTVSAYAYGTVSGMVNNSDGTQTHTWTLVGGSSTSIAKDALAIDMGQSGTDATVLEASNFNSSADPYYGVMTWDTDPTDLTPSALMGQLYGVTGTDEYGLFAGDYGFDHFIATPTSLRVAGTIEGKAGNIGGWALSQGRLTKGAGASYVSLGESQYATFTGGSSDDRYQSDYTDNTATDYTLTCRIRPPSWDSGVTYSTVMAQYSSSSGLRRYIFALNTAEKFRLNNYYDGITNQTVYSPLFADIGLDGANTTIVWFRVETATAAGNYTWWYSFDDTDVEDDVVWKEWGVTTATPRTPSAGSARLHEVGLYNGNAGNYVGDIFSASFRPGDKDTAPTWETRFYDGTYFPAGTGNGTDPQGNTWTQGVLAEVVTAYPIFVGSETATSAPFRVTQAGALTATNATITGAVTATSGTIGGWNIGATALSSDSGAVGMSTLETGGDDARFWAGHTTPTSAPFMVTEAGVLTASAGTIGGWSINASDMTSASGSAVLHDTGYLKVGAASADRVWVSGADASYRLWVGHDTAASAPFRVTKAGALVASDATITGDITATTGTLTDLDIDGSITLATGGVIKTSASGRRIEMRADGYSAADKMAFISGHASEHANSPGYITAHSNTPATPAILWVDIFAPDENASRDNYYLRLRNNGDVDLYLNNSGGDFKVDANLLPYTGGRHLGGASNRWDDVYLTSGSRIYNTGNQYIDVATGGTGSLTIQRNGTDRLTVAAGGVSIHGFTDSSGLFIGEDFDNVGDVAVLRAVRNATGTGVTEVGWYSSFLAEKEDIEPVNTVITDEQFDAIRPVTWIRKASGLREVGFIHEWIHENSPYFSGSGEEPQPGHVSERAILSKTIDVVQKLKAENDDLRARLERLEALLT